MLYIWTLCSATISLCLSLIDPPLATAQPVSVPLNKHARGGFDVPLKWRSPRVRRQAGDITGESGIGNNQDLLYSVPIEFGSVTTALHLDTGSSDLWTITEQCTTAECQQCQATKYPSSSLNSTGIDVEMRYGDSTTGTSASGQVAYETITVAGVAIQDQPFAAVTRTDNSVVRYMHAGIFGLGFPSGSKIQEALTVSQSGPIDETDDFISSTYAQGPLLSRISMTNALEQPMFGVSLQRNTIDIGGGEGVLSIGKLPDGVDNSSLTWVSVRLYSPDDGGLSPPTFALNEVYPFRWEIDIDAVYLNGNRLADSTVPTSDNIDATRVSGLLDTGNSLLRGPQDVVNNILSTVSSTFDSSNPNSLATFPCSTPHTMAFQIGGKMFPIDPRDFIGAVAPNDSTTCVADNLVPTDAPQFGATFRWSLGDPFFKSNVVVFHYGNLTHPSVDPPRIGLLSMVPDNADEALQEAVQDAEENGGNFESTYEAAPTASAATETQVTVFPTSVSWSSSTAATVNSVGATSSADAPQSTEEANSSEQPDNGALRITDVRNAVACSLFALLAFLL